MAQSVRVTLRAGLFSAWLPLLLAFAWWLSQRRGTPTPEQPCDLRNWGCSTGSSLIGTLLLFVILAVFPLFVIYAQHRLIWRSRTVLTVPQLILSLAPAPLFLGLAAVAVGVRGGGELAVLIFLAGVPTTVVAALQQAFIRRRLLRQGEPKPSSSPVGAPLAHLLFSCYGLLLLIGTILTWGPAGQSWQQLLPGIILFLLFLALSTGAYAAFALYFVVRSLTPRTALKSVGRGLSVLAGIVGVAYMSLWGLITALVQDGVVEEVTVGSSCYLGTMGDYPPVCYHSYDGGPLMKRECVFAEELGPARPSAPPSDDLAGEPSPGSRSPQSAPRPSHGPASPEASLLGAIVASRGDVGVIQTDASLGQKGSYAFAQSSDGSWVAGTTIIEDATFTDFVKIHSLLLAAFAPNPNFSIMVSVDDGQTWQLVDLQSSVVPEDMRYFHELTYADGTFILTTGYPSWVGTDDTNQWLSRDGLTWKQLHPGAHHSWGNPNGAG